MNVDLGSRDFQFINVVKEVRKRVLGVANVSEETWTAVPMQVRLRRDNHDDYLNDRLGNFFFNS